MGAIEDRAELLQVARELHAELRSHNARVNTVINKLIGEADKLALAAADERDADGKPKVQIITYGKKGTGTTRAADIPADATVIEPIVRLPGKRACSICGKPGHRRTTCPDANKHYQSQRKGKS